MAARPQASPFRILILEDLEDDYALVVRELQRDGIEFEARHVDNGPDFERSLLEQDWDVIISDFNLPRINAFGALAIVNEACHGTPFIVVSGSIGEEQAVELMRHGATDYLMKDRLMRLPAVVRREVREAKARRDRRQLQREMLHLQKIESLGSLAGGIAHNFRNVLMAISGFGELAVAKLRPDHPAYDDLQQMMEVAERSELMVQRILAFSRTHEDEPPAVFDMAVPINNAVDMLKATLPSTVQLHFSGQAAAHFSIGQSQEVEQVVVNICNNAAQALNGSTGEINITLEHATVGGEATSGIVVPGEYSVVTISDNGPGMSEEVRSRIFEPFFTTKPVGEGTGLGLATALTVITSMGGWIECDSSPGEGATFRLYIPSSKPGDAAFEAQSAVPERPGLGESVILVDDEQIVVNLMSAFLTQAGYRVTKFFDPASALAAFRANPQGYDLLVTDLAMPGMTGLELARKLREFKPGLPVVLSSGYTGHTDSVLFQHCDAVIPKPCTRELLYSAMLKALHARNGVA